MSFDNSKYDIALNNVGYRIQGYQKAEASTFIPRLGSGAQAESEFDLLRAKTIDGFAGGNLQRKWKDDKSIFGSESLFPIYDDGNLYPVKQMQALTNIHGKSLVTAWCTSDKYLFVATTSYNTPTTSILRIDAAGTVTGITAPTGLQQRRCTSMVIWNNELWVSSEGEYNLWYMSQNATTLTQVSASQTNGSPRLLCVYNGQLYGTNAGANDYNVHIWKYTGSKTAISVTSAGDTGIRTPDANANLFVFQGKIYLARRDSLWAYDGIRIAMVDDSLKNVSDQNYAFPAVLKGYLYYFMQDGFYRYNGSMIEKLYDISEIGFPRDVCTGKNRLWIIYSNSEFSGSSRYDKSMGYDYSSGNPLDGRVAVFDGKAMFTYGRTNIGLSKGSNNDFSGQGENARVVWHANNLYVFTSYEKTGPGTYFKFNTDEMKATGTSTWRLITSIFDADFAMVDKTLENLEILLDGAPSADETIAIEYRTTDFAGSTGWTNLGTFKTQSKLQESIIRSLPAGVVFKKIQFRLSGTTDVSYGIAKFVIRYIITPDFKYQWQFTVNAFGDNTVEPLMLKDGKPSTQKVSDLRGNIYTARSSDVPRVFIDLDQLDLNGAHNNSVTTFNINTTALLKDSGYVQIDDEIIYFAAKTGTTLTGCIRGVLGTAAAAHNDNAAVFPAYRVIVRQLANERIEMDDSDLDRKEDMSKPSQITIQLQEV